MIILQLNAEIIINLDHSINKIKDSIPQTNQKIISYVKIHLGKKVGSGQCWDLAQAALTYVHAKWDSMYIYGKQIFPEKDTIYPGDIIQFEGVKIEYATENGRMEESMGHHTAIVFKVNSRGNYNLAHQNYGYSGKKVGITNLDLQNITKGKYYFYRPQK